MNGVLPNGSMDPKTYNPRAWGARCDSCPLSGQKWASPTGPTDAPLAFVGEGPGKNEIIRGETLVGPSGAKLSEMLYANKVQRTQVFATNVLVCRPEVPGLDGKRRYDMKVYAAWFRKQNAERKKNGWPEQESPWACCRPRLLAELRMLEAAAAARGAPNGAVIVPLGNFALEATTVKGPEGKQPKGILKYRGSVLPVDVGALT